MSGRMVWTPVGGGFELRIGREIEAMVYNRDRAQRLAACWNHCDGIDLETMETGRPMLERVGLYLKRERDLEDQLAAARALLAEVQAENDKFIRETGVEHLPEHPLLARIRAFLTGGGR